MRMHQKQGFVFYLQTTDLVRTLRAKILAFIGNQIVGRGTKHTRRLELLQDNLITVHKNFQFVALSNIHCASDLDG